MKTVRIPKFKEAHMNRESVRCKVLRRLIMDAVGRANLIAEHLRFIQERGLQDISTHHVNNSMQLLQMGSRVQGIVDVAEHRKLEQYQHHGEIIYSLFNPAMCLNLTGLRVLAEGLKLTHQLYNSNGAVGLQIITPIKQEN